ncbi:Ribbon-helix-helix protein, copG family [Actinobacteria bacterium IMCC26256]|nr:Ribbon-helix-helix protein, copG family [Actinobacteria bacterium IMCC26256]
MRYHMVMSRRQVLVQLDDELVAQLDRIALEHGTNRSELLRQGALAVIRADDLRLADDELQASYRRTPLDPAIVESARRLAAETTPTW